MTQRAPGRRGSIYVLTLLTVAAVGSMVLIGVSVRTATSAESTITEQINDNSTGVFDAAEFAIARIDADTDWLNTAQKGSVFTKFVLGERTYSSTVVDADTLATPTAKTSKYRVTVNSASGIASESASIDLEWSKIDYPGYLASLGVDAYWPLDEAPKTSTAVEQFDSRDGTYQDPATAGAATNDEGGVVPDFYANCVSTPYDSMYNDDQEGTVSFWVKWEGTSTTITYGLFGQRFFNTSNGFPAVSLTMTNGGLVMYMDDGAMYDTDHFAWTTYKVIKTDTWHHVAVTWGPSGLRIYVDGTLEALQSDCTEYWDTQDGVSGQSPLYIAAAPIVSGSYPLTRFDGSIARFAILTDQLTNSQVADLASMKPDMQGTKLVSQSWAPVYD
jgi:hypothetical protein